jgi:Flp pilus assembly protein TadD
MRWSSWAQLLVVAMLAYGQTDPVYQALDSAYRHLKATRYLQSIENFERAAALAPARASIRKDLAYVLLKVGENERARDQFLAASGLDPDDTAAALEYAFLAHETGQSREARLAFDRLRRSGDAAAEQAFQNIDRPLAEGIARWTEAVEREPENFSAHVELAQLAEMRNDFDLAAGHLVKAWTLRPNERELLLKLGRVHRLAGRTEEAMSALLAASRAPEPRTAEKARRLLPARYPYVYEFEAALRLDAGNLELRREFAYLLLAIGKKAEGERELEKLAPELKPRSAAQKPESPKQMAFRSYDAGFLQDALRYLNAAHEQDPVDFEVMLKLGFTHNLLGQDGEAVRWFALARRAPDAGVSSEATRAYRNLRASEARVRTTVWTLPFYSSRWRAAFQYGQLKTEFKLGSLPFRPYASLRLIGDSRGRLAESLSPAPTYLSETAIIPGFGIATRQHKGLMAWAESGMAVSYLKRGDGAHRLKPDHRAGLSFTRTFGHSIHAESPGLFFEHHDDLVYVHRFNRSAILYTQNRGGYTFQPGPLRLQLTWNANATADPKRQYWANTVETGPGLRMRWNGLPPGVVFTADYLRGAHTVNEANPRRPNYYDLRIGFWYAHTR